MARSFPGAEKPRFAYEYVLPDELAALERLHADRRVPARSPDHLLLATWNIANFGAPMQVRRSDDIDLLTRVIRWFDLVALQEIRGGTEPVAELEMRLGDEYGFVFSDPTGNHERFVFLYRKAVLALLPEVGEIDVPLAEMRALHLKRLFSNGGEQQYAKLMDRFSGWDRSPYIATFAWGDRSFCVASLHLYYGDDGKASRGRRALEALAVAQWAHRYRAPASRSYTRDAIVVGDLNLPEMTAADPVYRALVHRGMVLPDQGSFVGGTTLGDKHYDHVMLGPMQYLAIADPATDYGVIDFDRYLFATLRNDPRRTSDDIRKYFTYYISDHRPVWARLTRVTPQVRPGAAR